MKSNYHSFDFVLCAIDYDEKGPVQRLPKPFQARSDFGIHPPLKNKHQNREPERGADDHVPNIGVKGQQKIEEGKRGFFVRLLLDHNGQTSSKKGRRRLDLWIDLE